MYEYVSLYINPYKVCVCCRHRYAMVWYAIVANHRNHATCNVHVSGGRCCMLQSSSRASLDPMARPTITQ